MESISEICTKLGIDMVAEGIETEEQFSTLRSCGVGLAQGFLFSRPISTDEYEERYLNTTIDKRGIDLNEQFIIPRTDRQGEYIKAAGIGQGSAPLLQ